MRRYTGIPELLETYMEENATEERWVTVQELRDRFGLTRYQCNTVSGFLRRLKAGPFACFPFIVVSITREEGENPSDPRKCRYLVTLRRGSAVKQKQTRQPEPAYGT
ncbi:MAG: hypothetical protein M0R30_11365 [Methanoregula sp.]|jgi:hypothetical protein|uniref:hypothetical protein n=1 Tax=Methanoregula sp. TaxID=2052170 RepID=UPI0025FDD559|nr:hypothetical protein [Methanoregula sp.]MCK9632223.1 hypothetical protein [Methanoregula sp.]